MGMIKKNTRFVVLMLLLSADMLRAEQDYDIRSSFPMKVGEVCQVTGQYKDEKIIVITVNDKVVDNTVEGRVVNFQGNVKLVEVSEEKGPEKLSVTVKSMTVVRKPKAKPDVLLPAGTELTVMRRDGRSVYLVGESEVATEVGKILKQLINLTEYQEQIDDGIIDTKKRRKADEMWPVDPEAVVKDFGADGVKFKKEDVTGTVRIAGLSRFAINVEANIDVKNVQAGPPIEDMKTVTTLRAKVSHSKSLPNDIVDTLSRSSSMNAILESKGEQITKDGRKVGMKSSFEMGRTVSFIRSK